MFLQEPIAFGTLTAEPALLACFFMAVFYVGSLYVWTSNLPRDHPQTIKERIRRVTLTCVLSVFVVFKMSDRGTTQVATVTRWLGIHTDAIFMAVSIPILLFMVLFLGPLYMNLLDDGIGELHPKKWKHYTYDLKCWRNYFVAPFSEELVFRGCMLPILLPVFGAKSSIILAPSFFGIAHIHHAWEKYFKDNYPLGTVVISTLFQAFYTTLFGTLSSWLFLRTGHLTSVVICHAFCNLMGFPDFAAAIHHEKRLQICTAFVVGLFMFFVLANPMTEPSIYANTLYAGTL